MDAPAGWADAARRAFDWIGSVAVDVDGGLGWLEGGALTDDLYSGTAGVLPGSTPCAPVPAAPAPARPVPARPGPAWL